VSELDRLRSQLEAYPTQDATRRRMLAFASEYPDALHRTCLAGHFTASALLLDASGERALLTHHRKLERWLQIGGHCDGAGDLARVAARELHEESGIAGITVDATPIDLDIHTIPARKGEPEHLHLDVRFLARAPEGALAVRNHESLELRWFTPAELGEIGTDDSVARLFALAFR
jgi:8-oxo-dGTP pyrophosphatase MutT (NUDIX family)